MRVLVAGWHGQVALALSEAAARRHDIQAYAVGRPAHDLTDRPSIGRTLLGIAPDVIINTASYTDVDAAELEPQTAFQRNKLGAEALATQAARIGIPIIHLSTVYVFDGRKSEAYVEDDETDPINTYGRSKLAGEAAVRSANPRHIILRTGWIYSPFARNFVKTVIDRANTGHELLVDDVQIGSPTYAPNLADAILDIARQITSQPNNETWGTYHIADDGWASWFAMAQDALRANARHTSPSPELLASKSTVAAHQAPRPRNARLDCTKLNDVFGIRLPTWQHGIANCVERLHLTCDGKN